MDIVQYAGVPKIPVLWESAYFTDSPEISPTQYQLDNMVDVFYSLDSHQPYFDIHKRRPLEYQEHINKFDKFIIRPLPSIHMVDDTPTILRVFVSDRNINGISPIFDVDYEIDLIPSLLEEIIHEISKINIVFEGFIEWEQNFPLVYSIDFVVGSKKDLLFLSANPPTLYNNKMLTSPLNFKSQPISGLAFNGVIWEVEETHSLVHNGTYKRRFVS